VHGDVILIALTFGNQSDWSRNVRAAGGCTIWINGPDYHDRACCRVTLCAGLRPAG
jgi:hypothetical protein